MLNLKIKLNMEQKTQLQESCLAFAKHFQTAGYSRCGWGYFLFFLNENLISSATTPLAYNVFGLGLQCEERALRQARVRWCSRLVR